MAIKFTSVKCPECGANLPIEEGREKMFCSYCGTQTIMTNENEHTYRPVDAADVKRAETEQAVVHRPGNNERLQKTIENIIINLLQNVR